jgi:hypothetical protein
MIRVTVIVLFFLYNNKLKNQMIDECPSRKYSNTENDEKDQGPDYTYKIISRVEN